MKSSETRRGCSALLLFLLLAAQPLLGAPPATIPGRLLDWNSALQAVANSDEQLQSAIRSENALHESFRGSYSTFYPNLTAYARRNAQDTQFIRNTNNENVVEFKTDSYGLEAKMNLFAGFGSVAHKNAAFSAWESAQADRQSLETDVLSTVRRSYGQIFVMQKRIGFLKRTSARLKLFAELLKVKYRNGTEAKWSVDQARVDSEALDLEIERTESMIQAEKEALATRMGTTPSFEVSPFPYPTLQELLKNAPDSHPRVRRAESAVRQTDFERKEISSKFWPRLDVYYKFEKYQPERYTWTDNHGWYVLASWEIFSGLSTTFDTRAKLEQTRSYELDLHNRRETLATDQARYKRAYEISRRLLKQKESQLEVAKTRLDVVESQFRTGRRSFSEWEQAEDYLSTVERDVIQTESGLIDDLSRLENALGIGLPKRKPGTT